MKNTIIVILSFMTFNSFSQNYWSYNIDFEDSSQFFRLEIDTVSNPNNIWQIGKPNKTLFTSAFSIPNAIVTDTVNPYPINDTSIFTIKHVADPTGGFICPHTAILIGKYKVNSDSLYDYGKIEFSPDNGLTWINILTDTIYLNYNYFWYSNKPILTGNSNGWVDFFVNLAGFGPLFNIQPFDTVQYRFSFISDSIQTNKDGLIFDNFHLEDYCEGIENAAIQPISTLYPNPSKEFVTIKFENNNCEKYQLVIYNIQGQIIDNIFSYNNEFCLNIKNYLHGQYFYKLFNIKEKPYDFKYGKFIKE